MRIAMYLRLSKEDEKTKESSSIKNQRKLILQYIDERSKFQFTKISEYVDDGFSGSNFIRPGIAQLLDDVKSKKIDCIIVKDFSRFGRSYLMVSEYIEQIFPVIGVRFISIADNYDSDTYCGGIEVSFRNLVYDLYSKDISKKVSTAKHTKMINGEYTSALAFFGYSKAKDNKNKLVINESEAIVVRAIFSMAISGMKTAQIARYLNEQGTPTPYLSKKAQGIEHKFNLISENYFWSKGAVYRILKDERYTGILVCGKTKAQSLHVNTRTKKESWIVCENTQEAIITREDFATAQSQLSRRVTNKTQKHDTSIVLRCAQCRHLYRKKHSYYYCETPTLTNSACCTDKIYHTEITTALQKITKLLLAIFVDADNINEYIEKENIDRTTKAILIAQRNKSYTENLTKQKLSLYEKYRAGTLDKTTYLHKKNKLESLLSDIGKTENSTPPLPLYAPNHHSLEDNFVLSLVREILVQEQNAYCIKLKVCGRA